MDGYAIALDLGTSGFRGQGIDLASNKIVSTCITMNHPLPGINTIDHLHYTLEYSVETARHKMIETINRLINKLNISIDTIIRLAVCGNPVQLSIFQGMEIRDLAYAGSRKLELLNVKTQEREARVLSATEFPDLCLPAQCQVIIPPAVSHQVGADAIALILQTGMQKKDEISIAIDFGTNAEMALCHNKKINTASAAAGSAIEGQQISYGMLAAPGAISGIESLGDGFQLTILDSEMIPRKGAVFSLNTKNTLAPEDIIPKGITGTGVIAIINDAIESGLIMLPKIQTKDNMLHLGNNIAFKETDVSEAGKAFGAIRAGYYSLCQETGINIEDIQTVYISGATGTYADALKARNIGLIPPSAKTIYQLGNTSLLMAKELAVNPGKLNEMSMLAYDLKKTYCMLASSEVFKKLYILELAYWNEGMPLNKYQDFLKKYGYKQLPPIYPQPKIKKLTIRDIDDFGEYGLTILSECGNISKLTIPDCISCMKCVEHCPQNAIEVSEKNILPEVKIIESICYGISCRKCEKICPVRVIKLDRFFN